MVWLAHLSRLWPRAIAASVVGTTIALTMGAIPVSVSAQSESTETYTDFMDWCMNRENLSEEAEYTVKLILEQAGTFNCVRASENLLNLTRLDLTTSLIKDVAPIGSLTNLTALKLMNNHISDVSPLANLKNLTSLDLSYNRIVDISPLANLTNLNELNLSYNQISDISPLDSLSELSELNLNQNDIADISSLQPLDNLTYLFVRNNPIADETCPVSPKYICQF
ncbi:leucine-rich repeat domain-containing protein [Lyngbya sp. CCY1209]|uniref:leucine-rich repeat domain-containing protein n=1 Tax=Lyngbya sp. CCY1209 TaxID=2886103 RepID=UPI002D20E96D|nr:leucine-rich repeat domain-containing protein [Lyngbya sp. CCY1209]MEB3885541.1 leucine-rich repeat domain-containing protein [Lyngbya sp. CCY1209]